MAIFELRWITTLTLEGYFKLTVDAFPERGSV